MNKTKTVPFRLELWTIADNYIGENYSDYYVGPSRSRDSGILAESNFEVAWTMLGGKETPSVIITRSSHWLCGWVEQILVHKRAQAKVKILNDIALSMEKYPVLDDSDYYEREREGLEDLFKGNESDFVSILAGLLGIEDPTPNQFKKLSNIVHCVLEFSLGYSGYEDLWFDKGVLTKLREHDWKDIIEYAGAKEYVLQLKQLMIKETV